MTTLISGAGLDRGSLPYLGDASDYMSPEYVAQHASEPAVQQKAERQRQATAQRDIEAEIKRVYPKWDTKPIKFAWCAALLALCWKPASTMRLLLSALVGQNLCSPRIAGGKFLAESAPKV
jgi:hypothetical protein